MFTRVEVAVRPEFEDPSSRGLLNRIRLAFPQIARQIRWARLLEVYWLDIPVTREQMISGVGELFWDRSLNWLLTGGLIPSAAGNRGTVFDLIENSLSGADRIWGLEKRFRAGVTDNVARTALEGFEIVLGAKADQARTASGNLFVIEGPQLTADELAVIAREVFCNELIESWTLWSAEELRGNNRFHPEEVKRGFSKVHLRKDTAPVEKIALDKLSPEQLQKLSQQKLWALSVEEMKAIRDYFNRSQVRSERQALGMDHPTDVEIEVLAQTWSEHCKHKLFNAKINYSEADSKGSPEIKIPEKIQSLFKTTISGTTEKLQRPWLLSVFSDNAGIVALDEESAVCIKVETHNSPSALDPYGGALTGIVGVNRDIIGCGRGARPIFNTNVFCLAVPDFNQPLPDRILHPRRILEGVRRGVEHGGNKSGIPTVNGALVFDERYLGKPLIYCGTGGLMPRESAGMKCESKDIQAGDKICMVGGRIGKDGIHGATFSSLALDETAPKTAVQLGDPIVQKRASDFLLEARDLGLYRTLTDNGAGGLSSSVGELARISNGARIELTEAKTKYPGLKPYELMISESQERMTVAVPPEKLESFLNLARRRSVEVSTLGEFTQEGVLEVFHEKHRVAYLDLEFLHEGVPPIQMDAHWVKPPVDAKLETRSFVSDGKQVLCELMSRPNIASKEWLIRQYDHEVQGTSVVKPLHTIQPGTRDAQSGPNDAAVLKPKPNSYVGIAVGCGIQPKYSDIDPYLMAQMAVDESVRNILAVGAEYGTPECLMALVDNFCMPDPVADPQKAAGLVRACFGLKDAALALGTPLVSGKDSMKNDFHGFKEGKPVTISVPPTLLMTALGRLKNIRFARTADFKQVHDLIYLVGPGEFGLLGSELHQMAKEKNASAATLPGESASGRIRAPKAHWEVARQVYTWLGGSSGKQQIRIRSLHDISEGGLLVALSECLLGRGYGADLNLPDSITDRWEFCFGEGFHSFVMTVTPHEVELIEQEWKQYGVHFTPLGQVTSTGALRVRWNQADGAKEWSLPVQELRRAWKKIDYWE